MRIEFSADDRAEILRRIDRALALGRVAQGENVEEFEGEFARYLGARHAVAVSSGGAAIEVARQSGVMPQRRCDRGTRTGGLMTDRAWR